VKVSEKTLTVMRLFVESRGYEFPETHTHWSRSCNHPWTVIRVIDRQAGGCYAAWCHTHKKVFNKIQNLEEFTTSRKIKLTIGDWVLWMPWFPHAHRYGKVIDFKPCNHSEELFPIVNWLDGSISFASTDFCEPVERGVHLWI
jgi:hypothetical protein